MAEWYAGLLEQGPGTYQHDVILPNLQRRMAIKKGETVLDLACGPGFFARKFASVGARVIASDISAELILLGKKQPKTSIDYHVAPADKIPFVKNGTVDKAVIVLALQNIENMNGVFHECARVLTLSGSLHLVLNHPSFRIPKASEWGWDAIRKVQYRRIDRYLTESKIGIQMHPGDKPDETTVSFHRPLQSFVKALSKNGFAVTWTEEWTSHKKSDSGPRAKAENVARGEFPLFLYLEAKKQI